MYKVQATIERTNPDGSILSVQIPTFFLNEDYQGIMNEYHARSVVHDILNPFSDKSIRIVTTISKLPEAA